MNKIRALIELARPSHWVKNLLVFAALLFSQKYGDGGLWLRALLAFAGFCLLSSGVYAWNDIFDRKTDAVHPRSRRRPIPSGRLTPLAAAIFGTVLLAGGFAVMLCLPGNRSIIVAAAYLVLNVLYNLLLRHRPIIDVVTVAMGFVLRAVAGGAAIDVSVSAWLIVCTFMLCTFLALIKRRSDILTAETPQAKTARPAHAFYSPQRLDHMLGVTAGLAVVTYTLYCLVSPHSPGAHMVWTVPIVLYAMFRLYGLAVESTNAGPIDLIRRDPVLWIAILLWLGTVLAVMEYSDLPQASGWITQ